MVPPDTPAVPSVLAPMRQTVIAFYTPARGGWPDRGAPAAEKPKSACSRNPNNDSISHKPRRSQEGAFEYCADEESVLFIHLNVTFQFLLVPVDVPSSFHFSRRLLSGNYREFNLLPGIKDSRFVEEKA
jgi:hypothetical protein